MMRTLAPVAALLFAVALLLAGNGLLGTLIPVRAQIEDFSIFSIGLLGSTYFVGFASGCFYGPHLVQRVGHIRTFTAMAAIVSAVVLGHGMVVLPLPWWIMRVLTGFCFAVLYIVIESWLNERSTNETRGSVLSAYLVINLTVMTVGQMMITLSDPAGLGLFALASILVSIAAVPVALSVSTAPRPIVTVRLRFKKIFATSPVAFTACVAVGLANGAFWTLGPLFVQRAGFDVGGVALFMSATVLGGALGQWPVGRLSDNTDRAQLIVWVALAAAVLGVAVVGAGFLSLHWLLLAAACWGAVAFPLYAVAVAQANDHAKPDEFVEISSGMLLAYAAGAVIGPVIATIFMKLIETGGLYVFTITIHLLLVVYAWRQLARETRIAAGEHLLSASQALQSSATISTVFDAEMQESNPGTQEPRPDN
ncbi:MAG: MFS transporter [Gammaproteobacteria bacterium]|nr:MFS transporter [Gammaproteobacteria bacterium]MDH3535246.1 MFS transporter [Gammaproteobacteria bacterium]